jgi:hypothetical protein
LDAPGEGTGGGAGVLQGTLAGGVLEELPGVVVGGLGLGESSGQCRPGGVGEDLLGVVGQGGSYVLGVLFHGAGWWLALGQGGQ